MSALKRMFPCIFACFFFLSLIFSSTFASGNSFVNNVLPEDFPEQLKAYIANLSSALPDKRISGIKGVSEYLDAHPESLRYVVELVDDSQMSASGITPGKVAEELIEQVGKKTLKPLLRGARHIRGAVRKKIIEIIGSLNYPESVDPLIGLLKIEKNRKVRELISKIVEDQVMSIILGLNMNNVVSIRKEALRSLGKIKNPFTTEIYLSALKLETEISLRVMITARLKSRRDPLVKGPFKDIVVNKEESITVRRNVAAALRNFRSRDLIEQYIALLGERDSLLSFLGKDALKRVGLPKNIEALMDMAKNSSDTVVRLKVLKGLSHIETEGVTRLFSDMVMDIREESTLRYFCFSYLSGAGKTGFLTPLLLINDPDPGIREMASVALEQTNLPEAREILLKALKNEKRPEVRKNLYAGLGKYVNRKILALNLSPDPSERMEAARVLGNIGSPDAVESLVLAVDSEKEGDVRLTIVESLIKTKDRQIVLPLIRLLKKDEEDAKIRIAAAAGLSGFSGRKVLEALAAALQSGEPDLRRAAVVSLRGNKNERVTGILLKLLGAESNGGVRSEIIENLKLSDNPRVTSLLLKLAGDKSEDVRVRRSALSLLKERWEPAFRGLFTSALSDRDKLVRKIAIAALTEEGNTESGEPLIKALHSENDPDNRRIIMEGLTKLRDPLTLKPFSEIIWGRNRLYSEKISKAIKRLYSPDLAYRAAAADLLGKKASENPEFINFLTGILNDRSEVVLPGIGRGEVTTPARIVLKHLSALKGVPVSLIGMVLKTGNDPVIRVQAASILKDIGNESAIKLLANALEHEVSPDVRQAVANALKGKGGSLVRDAFIELLRRGDYAERVRIIASSVISGYMEPEILKPLLDVFMKESSPRVKANLAILFLGADPDSSVLKGKQKADYVNPVKLGQDFFIKGDKENLEPLIDALLNHPSVRVRKNAISALEMVDPENVPERLLLKAVESEKERGVRKELLRLLAVRKSKFMAVPFAGILVDESEDSDLRRVAAEALLELKVPFVYENFRKVLSDSDPYIRKLAVKVLLESNRFEDDLIARLDMETDDKIRYLLAEGLSGRKNINAVLPFQKIAVNRNEDITIRRFAAGALVKLDVSGSVRVFLSLIEDRDPVLQGLAIKALIESRAPASVDPLLDAMNREENSFMKADIAKSVNDLLASLISDLESVNDPRLRSESAIKLGKIRYYVATDSLLEALPVENNREVKLNIARALKDRNSSKIVPYFKELLLDRGEDDAVREIAGVWIIKNSDELSFSQFERLLGEQSSVLRGVAVDGLEKSRDNRAVPVMLKLFKREESLEVKRKVLNALISFQSTHNGVPLFLAALFSDSSESTEFRRIAGERLIGNKSSEAARSFISSLDDSDTEIKEIASKGLQEIKGPEKTLFLVSSLESAKEGRVKSLLVQELSGIEDDRKIIPLLKIIHSVKESLKLRYKAAEALSGPAGDDAAKAYMSFLDHKNPVFRKIAARGLKKVKSPLAAVSLMTALEVERDPEVKLIISDSAGVISGPPARSSLAEVVKDRRKSVKTRKTVLRELIGLKGAGLPEILYLLLNRKDNAALQQIAAKELAGSAGGQKLLVDIIRGANEYIPRKLAAEELSVSGYVFVKELFASLLTDDNEDWQMRNFIYSLYKNMEDPKSVDVYRRLLKDPDPDFRLLAIEELEALSPPDKESLFEDLLKRENNAGNRERVSGILKGHSELADTDKTVAQKSEFPPEVAIEIERLESDNSRERGAAALKLGEFGKKYPGVIPYLLKILGNDDAVFKIKKKKEFKTTTPALEAVKALGQIGEPAFAPLLEQAVSGDRLVRLYSVMAIGAIEEDFVVESMIKLISGEQDPYVRKEITKALKKHSDGKIIELFLGLLKDKSEFQFVRIDAAEYLSRTYTADISGAMRRLLKERNKKLRLIASEYFTKNSTEGAVDALISAFEREPVISAKALLSEALKLSNDPKTIPVFIEQMKRERTGESSDEFLVRKNIMEGLFSFNDPRAFATYTAVLEDEDPEVREVAVKGLGALADPEGLPVLLDRFGLETDEYVRKEIVLAISSFDEPVVVRKLVKIVKKDKDMEFRLVAIRSLGKSKDPDATNALIKALKDPEGDIQGAVIDALTVKKDTLAVDRLLEYSDAEENDPELRKKAKQGVHSIVDSLVSDLSSAEPRKREAAASRLSIVKNSLILEPFITALKTEKRVNIRLLLLKGLKEQKSLRKVEPLLSIFVNKDEKNKTRRAAVDALKGRVTWEVVNILKDAFFEKDARIRKAAAERIAENGDPRVISILIEAFKRESKKQNRVKIVEKLKGHIDSRLITFFSELASDRKEKYKIRLNAAEGLKNQKDPSSFEIFANLLMEKKAGIRAKGVEGIGGLNDPLSVKMLLKLLESEKVGSVRHKAVEVLSKFDSPEINPVFIKILLRDDENFKLRKLAANYLKERGGPEALDAFIKVLNGKDSALQKIASERLLIIKDPRLVAPFITLLSDRDSVLRNRAVKGLMNNMDSKSLGPLIAAEKAETDPNVKKVMTEGVEELVAFSGTLLLDGDLAVKKYVSAELSKIEDSRTLEISVKALETEKNFSVRERLTEGLKKLDDPVLVPILINIMGDSEENAAVRTNAADGLKKAFLPEIFAAFASLLSDPDPALRGLAARAVSEYGEAKALRRLLKAIKTEKDPEVRVIISEGLRELKDPDLMDTLIKVMLDLYEEPRVRQNAASGLKYMKDKKSVIPFISVIADDDAVVRLTAVEGLTESGDLRRVAPFISRLSVETEPKIRTALTEGLKGVDDVSSAPSLKKMLKNGKELLKTRQNAAVILSELTGGGLFTDVFRVTVSDPDPLIRGVSATALTKTDDPELLRLVLSLLARENDEKVRLRITGALKGLKSPIVISPVIDILENEEESVPMRRSAAEVLAGIKNPLVVNPLREGMKSDDTPIRVSSARGLRLNLSKGLKDVFFQGLRDGNPSVRYESIWALNDLDYLRSMKKAAKVVKELNISEYLKTAITRGVYSRIPMGRGMGIKAIVEKGKEFPSTIFFLINMLYDESFFFEGKKRDRKVFVGEHAADALGAFGDRAVAPLADALMKEKSERARINASRAFLGLGGKLDKTTFFKILEKERSSRVRTNLFRVLEKEGFEGGLEYLLSAFADRDELFETRHVAGKGLLRIASPKALPVMRAAMSDNNDAIREIAAEGLRKLGSGEDIEYLRQGLRDQSRAVRYQSVSGLLGLRGFKNMVGDINELRLPVGLKNALKRLYSDNPKTRGLAINYAGRGGVEYPLVNPFLASLLGDEAEYEIEVEGFRKVKTPALEAELALVKNGKSATDSLVALLGKELSDGVRGHVVNALVAINDPETVADLIEVFKKEKNSSIRVALSKRLMTEKDNKELKGMFLGIVNDKHDHWMVRYNAVKALMGVKGTDVTDALLFALKDEDSVIRGAAAEGLIGGRNRKALRPLINALDDEYAVVRYNAAQALRNIRSRKLKKVYKDIVAALDDFDPVVRAKAAETLGALNVKSAVPRLVVALRDPDAGVRTEAAKVLGLLKVSEDKEAVALLNSALTDQNKKVRDAAITSLLLTKNSKVISTVYEAFKEDEWSVRENAVAILKRLDNPKAVKYMVEAVSSRDKGVRLRLVEAFAHMGEGQVPLLASLAEDESVRVRRKVAWALGKTGGKRAVEPLKLLMSDRDHKTRVIAADSISKIGILDLLISLLKDDDDYLVRKRLLEGVLRVKGGQERLDLLYRLLTDRDVRIRKMAALGLGKVGNQFSVEYLIQALRGRWSGIRVEAARSLGDLNDPLATGALLDALESGSMELRKSASVALEKITDHEGKPTLEHWKGVKKRMMAANVRESGRLLAIPLAGLLVILLFL